MLIGDSGFTPPEVRIDLGPTLPARVLNSLLGAVAALRVQEPSNERAMCVS
jgi:hypothetical protein